MFKHFIFVICCVLSVLNYGGNVVLGATLHLRKSVLNQLAVESMNDGDNGPNWLECHTTCYNEDTIQIGPAGNGMVGIRPGGATGYPPYCTKKCTAKFDVPKSVIGELPGGTNCAGNPKVVADFEGAELNIEGKIQCIPCGENPNPTKLHPNNDAKICGLGNELIGYINPTNWADWGSAGQEVDKFFNDVLNDAVSEEFWSESVGKGFTKTANDAVKEAEKIGNDIADAGKSAGNAIADTSKKTSKKIKKIFG